MGRATRTECHCQRWVKNKNKMRESCWHAGRNNVRQLEFSTPQLHHRLEVLKVVSSLVVASTNGTLLTRAGDPWLRGRACRLGVLIHFDEATDSADAAHAEIFCLAKSWRRLSHHGGAEWGWERAKDGGTATVISGAEVCVCVCACSHTEVNESDHRFRFSWNVPSYPRKTHFLFLFIRHFWRSVCHTTTHSLLQYLTSWTIQRSV